jgi:hydroxymethylpyrimidine/phosphomethylpyrimidine kinase
VALTVPPGLPLVVDPVMVATSGARLLAEPAVAVYRQMLCPRATLVTPNLDEAAVLLGEDDIPPERLFDAASVLADRLGCAVLLKGGHLRGDPLDVLRHPGGTAAWRHPRIGQVDTHGSGCMLSAAVAAQLARGHELVTACEAALAFVHRALEHGRPVAPGLRLADIEAAGRLAGEGGSSPLQRLQ